mmetsp:Transcript_133503/g.386463  ORF Transcript_133503/g.386463 Transcript_133503/m.386463 type:complete len:217 (-) Transcript_133503:734-1384(-)
MTSRDRSEVAPLQPVADGADDVVEEARIDGFRDGIPLALRHLHADVGADHLGARALDLARRQGVAERLAADAEHSASSLERRSCGGGDLATIRVAGEVHIAEVQHTSHPLEDVRARLLVEARLRHLPLEGREGLCVNGLARRSAISCVQEVLGAALQLEGRACIGGQQLVEDMVAPLVRQVRHDPGTFQEVVVHVAPTESVVACWVERQLRVLAEP